MHAALLLAAASLASAGDYPWLAAPTAPSATIGARIATPEGFKRLPVEKNSFAEWLRGLPLKPVGAPVMLFNKQKKKRQDVHAAVVDLDVGERDLQQCADAVMRLWAEYQWSRGNYAAIHFNDGESRKMRYAPGDKADRVSFRKYLNKVFALAGSYSLSRELTAVALKDLQAGDVFIRGGFPGHAVIVVDVAADEKGRKVFLLAQSYMPAQDVHVLKNEETPELSPWFYAKDGAPLETPEWTFKTTELKRFPATEAARR